MDTVNKEWNIKVDFIIFYKFSVTVNIRDMYDTFNLEERFYEEEIRCDYLVTKKQKKIWAVELELINELLRVCNKYNIKVYAYAGTMLGAIRHSGFIPWDDDADFCLLHDDYLKLVEVAPKEFKEPFFFQTALSDRKYFFRYARLRNSLTTGLITENLSEDYNNGIFIDIFVLNGYQSDEKKLKKQRHDMKVAWKACRAYIADIKEKKWYKKPIIGLAKLFERTFFSYEKLVNNSWNAQSRYDESAEKVTLMTHGEKIMRKYWCYKSDFDEVIYVPFENLMVPIPKEYNTFLKNAYGNFMDFPPVNKRGKWHEGVIVFDPDIPYKEYIRRNTDLL